MKECWIYCTTGPHSRVQVHLHLTNLRFPSSAINIDSPTEEAPEILFPSYRHVGRSAATVFSFEMLTALIG